MTEEIKTDEKFQQAALFDLEFEKREQRFADNYNNSAKFDKEQMELNARGEEGSGRNLSDLHKKTSAMIYMDSLLQQAKRTDPALAAQTEAYLDQMINTDMFLIQNSSRKRDEFANKTVDVDGSKKSLWGKLKNKAKNFWKPFNLKRQIEGCLSEIKQNMVKYPDTYEWLQSCTQTAVGVRGHKNAKISFSQLFKETKEIQGIYNSQRVESMKAKEYYDKVRSENLTKAQSHEATIDAIHQVRDNAAKEIELRSAARENIGVKDAQANTGVDKLADKAKAMEGMTQEQRLAFRMSQLRGTSKETPTKPVQKRDVDSNVMNKALESKMRA